MFLTRIPRVALRSPSKGSGRCFGCRQFGHFDNDCPEKDTCVRELQHREERASKHKGSSHLYEGGQEVDDDDNDDDDEVLAAMYHSGETYSSIHPNREDEEHYKQLNK